MVRYPIVNVFIGMIVLLTLASQSHASLRTLVPFSAPARTQASTHVLQQRTLYWVTKQDLIRGYLEILSSVRVEIETSASAINLSVLSLTGETILTSLAGEFVFNENLVIRLSEAERATGHTIQNLDVRVLLDDFSQAGLYPLNIQLGTNTY